MKRITITLAVAAIFVISARGQSFLNLDFESAQNMPGNPGNGQLVSVSNALPYWAAYSAANALVDIYYVSNVLGRAVNPELEGGSLALSGNFSLALFGDSSISQIGLVSATAESLQFEAQGQGPGGSLEGSGFAVTLGGQYLPLSALSTGPDYTVYGASIPAGMDGQVEDLVFGCQGVGSGQVVLDDIVFSPESVPEPGLLALTGLGSILLAIPRLRKFIRRQCSMARISRERRESDLRTFALEISSVDNRKNPCLVLLIRG